MSKKKEIRKNKQKQQKKETKRNFEKEKMNFAQR